MTYIGILLTFVLVNNLVLTQFLGLCPLVGVSRDKDSAVGLGFAVTFVMSIAALATWAVYRGVLVPFKITYLQTVVFILVIVVLVQLVEKLIQRASSALYQAIGVYFPLITTNCAVLGIALIAVRGNYTALESLVAGCSAGLGFLLVMVLMSHIREELELEWVPKPFRGMPIAFITAGLMALAFMAFDRALLKNLVG
jgi:Na+-translocating ferredoxin:NAD+ oxidoreductase subunit A